MTTQPADGSLTFGASGIPDDVPCPQCRYNLRGLTVPRCPECGLTFEWSDLERFRVPPESWTEAFLKTVGAGLLLLFALLVLVATGPALAVLAAAAGSIVIIAGVQTCVEFLVALAWVGPWYWPRFRTWCEGVLIGYGATAMTWLAFGYEIIPFEPPFRGGPPAVLWSVLLLTTAETIAIQWLVVRRQFRIRNQVPVPARGLWCACVLAKVVSAILWLGAPVALVGG